MVLWELLTSSKDVSDLEWVSFDIEPNVDDILLKAYGYPCEPEWMPNTEDDRWEGLKLQYWYFDRHEHQGSMKCVPLFEHTFENVRKDFFDAFLDVSSKSKIRICELELKAL